MKKDLATYEIDVDVMYDWATDKFKPVDIQSWKVLYEKYIEPNLIISQDGILKDNPDRPFLIMSSTSFTEDENFMVMIEGLDLVQSMIDSHPSKLPDIRVTVTGKGP